LSRLRVFLIVEGEGDARAAPILLRRIWTELLGGEYLEVLKPYTCKRQSVVQPSELARILDLAVTRLRQGTSDPAMILVLIDADNDPACTLGPELLAHARAVRGDVDVSCVIADVDFETWFAAAAVSLTRFLNLPENSDHPETPEHSRRGKGKGWIKQRYPRYSPTVDQPRMTAAMDLHLCRQRSPSFDKLCRELEKRLQPMS